MKFLHKIFHHISFHSLVFVSILTVVAVGFAYSKAAFADDPSASTIQRMVTVHDGDNQVTVMTRAGTVRDALKAAEVPLGERDIVEPSTDTKLIAKSYQINVFRARPVVVIDGTRRVRVMTAEQSPLQIAKAAGLTLFSEDTTTFKRVDEVLLVGGAGMEMVVQRAKTFNFTLYGKKFTARTQATTIAELLTEKGIVLGVADGVAPAKDTPITNGLEVRVWRNGKQTVSQEEVVTKPTEEIKDADQNLGVRTVKEAGADGKRNVTYEIETKDGVEVSRKEIASVVMTQPIKQVVVVGTKVSLPPGSHTDWMRAAGIAESDFGYVEFIIGHESGWGVTKYNYGGSGAYGLCQSLPASKMASAGSDYMSNPITQLKWCNGYAAGRYGGWAGAYSFWTSHKWW